MRFDMSRINEPEFRRHLMGLDSFELLPGMLELSHRVEPSVWVKALGEEWTRFDNVSQFGGEVVEVLAWMLDHPDELSNVREMMDDAERKAFDALPDVLTIYRGAYEHNKWGYSWTTDRAIAEAFPFLNRYRGDGRPLLIKATIEKSRIAAVKLDRDEMEVVTFIRPKCLAIYTAKDTGPKLPQVA
jgi:hypothetical protein